MFKALCLFLALQLLEATEANDTSSSELPTTSARRMQQPCIDGIDNCDVCNSDGTACTTCFTLYELSSQGVCVWTESCPITNYFDPDLPGCRSCESLFNLCDSCTRQGCTLCKIGYYLDPNTQQCSRCNSGCGDCTSYDKCIRCMETYSAPYSDGSCPTSNIGTFYNTATGRPEFCGKGCKTCDANSCTKCWGWDATISGQQCYCYSYSYHYYMIGTSTFQSCHHVTLPAGCLSYDGNTFDPWGDMLCYECSAGYFREGHQCFPCSSGCKECSDRYTCTKCNDELNASISGSQCICNDSHSYFNTTIGLCKSCPLECSTCSSYDYCTGCLGYTNFNGYGKCICSGRSYFNFQTLLCTSCEDGCSLCDATHCIRCSNGYYLYDNSGVMQCRGCSSSCNSCDSNSDCFQCGTSVELESNQCTENTNLGYKIHYQDSGLLILDFPYSLPYYLSIKEIIVKNSGFYQTSSWWLERVNDKQYIVHTNLSRNNLPIDVRFKFNHS